MPAVGGSNPLTPTQDSTDAPLLAPEKRPATRSTPSENTKFEFLDGSMGAEHPKFEFSDGSAGKKIAKFQFFARSTGKKFEKFQFFDGPMGQKNESAEFRDGSIVLCFRSLELWDGRIVQNERLPPCRRSQTVTAAPPAEAEHGVASAQPKPAPSVVMPP